MRFSKDAHSHFVSPWWADAKEHTGRMFFGAGVALMVGVAWQSLWLYLLTKPYEILSRAQYQFHVKMRRQEANKWQLSLALSACAMLRGLIRFWITWKWVVVLFLAWWEAEKMGQGFWDFKINMSMLLCTAMVPFFPYMLRKTCQLYMLVRGLRHQPSRRHGRHESTLMELWGGALTVPKCST